jgi:hypothetical protein
MKVPAALCRRVSRLVPSVAKSLAFAALLSATAHAAAPKVYSYGNAALRTYVRPGGTTYTWSYDSTVASVAIFFATSVDPVVRGRYEYSSNNGGSWTAITFGTTPNYIPTAGKIFRFVDVLPSDTTTSNSLFSSTISSNNPNSNTSGGVFISADTAPTDIISNYSGVFDDATQGSTVATLTPTDLGEVTDGVWVLESQSVPNLFTLSSTASNNPATLVLGSGTKPALGQTATVTVRYHDLYQTDTSGVAVAGQGVSRTLTYTVVTDVTTDLPGLGSEFSVNQFTANPQTTSAIARLSTGDYAVVWRSLGQGGDATSTGAI